MRTEQRKWTREYGWSRALTDTECSAAHLLFAFGTTAIFKNQSLLAELQAAFPQARILGCTTAGEIFDTAVLDDSLVVTAVMFEHTQIRGASVSVGEAGSSFESGETLARSLPKSIPGLNSQNSDPLTHVFVLSDGLKVNGSELVDGLTNCLPENVAITGGLAGDGPRFGETLTLWDNVAAPNAIIALGLYGSRVRVGFGSFGGYDPFGPERLVTRSAGNVLFELDGRSALDLYKKYLGEHAKGLPATGLLFPLGLRNKNSEAGLVRTILNVDEAAQSLTFAGDIPEGSYARLMTVNFDRLIDGAVKAATASCPTQQAKAPDLALLVSCAGRKWVLKQRIEEEVEAVRGIFGDRTMLAGFYSYGEIAPFMSGAQCELHNQSMTITTISEF